MASTTTVITVKPCSSSSKAQKFALRLARAILTPVADRPNLHTRRLALVSSRVFSRLSAPYWPGAFPTFVQTIDWKYIVWRQWLTYLTSVPGAPAPHFPFSGAIWGSYFFRKFLRALVTIFVVTTIIFFLVRLLPGNPIEIYVNQLIVTYGMPVHEAKDQAAALFAIDLEQPIILQYFSYLRNLARGNFGKSVLSPGTTVTEVILRFLPWTLFSVGLGLTISFTVGVLLGVIMAYRRESFLDHGFTFLSSVVSSVPDFVIGLLIVVWLGVQWKILPIAAMRGAYSSGMVPGLNLEFFADALFHGALPISTYVLTSIGFWMLSMKSNTVSTLG